MALLDIVTAAVARAGAAGPDVTPGTVAAWGVVFREDTGDTGSLDGKVLLAVGSETYDGSVTATLPKDLSGGSYQVVIEGMTDDDYKQIQLSAGRRLAAALHLWWKDSPSSVLGDLARVTGLADRLGALTPDPPEHSLVAVLRVDTIRRRAGERRYEVVVTARERVVARLVEHRVDGRCFVDLEAAVRGVTSGAGVTAVAHGLVDAKPGPADPDFADVAPGPAADALSTLVARTRRLLGLYGLPAAVVRDGVVHVGKWSDDRGAVAGLGVLRGLDQGSGLVSVDRGPNQDRDAAAGERPKTAVASRGTVTVTTLGRPDIKPGDIVRVALPPEDFPLVEPPSFLSATLPGMVGPLTDLGPDPGSSPSSCRVREVTHKLSPRQGFVTTVEAVVLAENDDGWDPPAIPGTPSPTRSKPAAGGVAPDAASAAATAVQSVMRGALGALTDRTRSRVALVHDHSKSGVPRHTSDVWYADVAPDGRPAAAQRTEITEAQHAEMRQVPYLTPFGWGNFGLVLPRYPGTRVLLVNAGGGQGDYVDVGALWPRDAGPPADPGDYWLVLPVGVEQREHLGSDDPTPADGPAAHDLVDGDGTRVVETARFVVRVTDTLTRCTARPTPGPDAPAGSVLIETKSSSGTGASIRLRDDGSVTITGTSITLDTKGDGDISLNAKNVKVTVATDGTMDVS
jgi:hypothetical protein